MTNEQVDQQIQDEGPLADAKRLEPEITARTHAVLHRLRRQLSKSWQQQALDRFIDIVAPTFVTTGLPGRFQGEAQEKCAMVVLRWRCHALHCYISPVTLG